MLHTRPPRGLPGVLFATLVLVLIVCAGAMQQSRSNSQASSQTSSDTINRPTSQPYTGDPAIFEDFKRDRNLQISRVMDVLGLKKGSDVADVGAGSGWFTVRAAPRVGSSGQVYAVDINRDYLKYIEGCAQRENLSNVRTVLGKQDDPLLPQQSVDAVLMLKTYHEIAQPIQLLKRLQQSMRSGARLGIIDRNGTGDDHGLNRATVVSEARRAGFELVEEYNFVKTDGMDYFLVFQSKK